MRVFGSPGLAALAALALALPAPAQEGAEPGAAAYGQYCASCHGVDGLGDGPMSELMSVEVPDLTQMRALNNGAFPMLEVIHIIDGRTGLRGHGGPMPVWGALFDDLQDGAGRYGAPLETRGLILSIAYHIEALQND